MSAIYFERPFERASTSATPIMPMLPAKEVSIARPLLVSRFFSESDRAVAIDIEVPLNFRFPSGCAGVSASPTTGLVSEIISPSSRRIMRSEYFSASWPLCVTIITSRVLDISLSISMTCILVCESSAPVGSSASIMSGLLTSARAIATRCIWPPES